MSVDMIQKALDDKKEEVPPTKSQELLNACQIIDLSLEVWKEIEMKIGNTMPEAAKVKVLDVALIQNTRHIFHILKAGEDAKDAMEAAGLTPEERLIQKGLKLNGEPITESQLRYLFILRRDSVPNQDIVKRVCNAWGKEGEEKISKAQGILLINFLKPKDKAKPSYSEPPY